jgi:hypothetical protein
MYNTDPVGIIATTPAQYLVGQETGAPMTVTPESTFVWYGYFKDTTGDNVIRDTQCAGNDWNFCPPETTPQDGTLIDEFIWRGNNTGEDQLGGFGWNFPGSYDQGVQPGNVYTNPTGGNGPVSPVDFGSGLAGDCRLYGSYDTDCVSPAPSWALDDQTNATGGNGQRWAVSGGWAATPITDALITNHVEVDSIGNVSAMRTSDLTLWKIGAPASTPGFFLTYNWYQSVTNDAITPLYTTAAHAVRDNYNFLNYNVVNPTRQGLASVTDNTELCPTQPVAACFKDVRQTIAANNLPAVTPTSPRSPEMPYMSTYLQSEVPADAITPGSDFASYWCLRAGVDAATCQTVKNEWVGGGGVYGFVTGLGYPLRGNGESSGMPPTLELWGIFNGYVWTDVNGDGFIGNPDAYEISQYEAGNFATANVAHTTSTPDIVAGAALAYVTTGNKGLLVSPPSSGWPTGSFEDQNGDGFLFYGAPLGDPSEGNHLLPLTGTTPAFLRVVPDSYLCGGANPTRCISKDGLIVPTGSELGLTGDAGSVTMTWTDPTSGTAYSYTQDVHFSESLFAAPDPASHA